MNPTTNLGWREARTISLLSLFALAVHGYHPYSEDGGLYLAGVKRALQPAMYGANPVFVTAPTHFSLFAPLAATAVRLLHLPLDWFLLGFYCTGIWSLLFAGWMLIARCVRSDAARIGAVTLLACWVTLPIAGTSLMLMDPYVTARTVSTPLVLMALAWALDGTARSWGGCAAALLAAALVHPLTAGYGMVAALLLACGGAERRSMRLWGTVAIFAAGGLLASLLQAIAPTETQEYGRIVMTRYYWFPWGWKWYEQLGLAAPLLLIAMLQRRGTRTGQKMARAAVGLGCLSLAVALLFARAGLATHLVARLQPLRCFAVVYEVMILLLGAWLGERWLRRVVWRWATLLAICGGAMFFFQRSTYPASNHLEVPGRPPANQWERAFLWIRDHTPRDALVALDAHYITRGRGEDAQCFRAVAERDALPDYSKDGGEAAIAPWLSAAWTQGQAVQTGLEDVDDTERERRVRPSGATWIVLEATVKTSWSCPYMNASVKVCRVP